MLRICSIFVLLLLTALPLRAEVAGKVRVTDGDSIYVGGVEVRLYGIDAPERDQTCETPEGATWDCGAHVRQVLIDRYQGRMARCTVEGLDRYGRTLGVCEVGGVNINRELVADGWAFAFRRYSMMFDLDEKGAVVNGRGLHGQRIETPSAFRAARRAAAQAAPVAAPQSGCAIKGNISAKGTRIFHVPGQKDYAATRINTAKGERWFCSAAEAEAAGWRAARR